MLDGYTELPESNNYRSGGDIGKQPMVRFSNHPYHVQIRGFSIDLISHSVQVAVNFLPHPNIRSRNFAEIWLSWQSAALSELEDSFANTTDPAVIFQTHIRNLTMDTWGPYKEFSDLASITASDWPEVIRCYWEAISFYKDFVRGSVDSTDTTPRSVDKLLFGPAHWSAGTYFFIEQGRVGRGCIREKPGDVLVVLYSAKAPFILHYEEGSNVAKLIGEAYLDGCMDYDTMPSAGRGPDEWFNIG